MERSELSGLSAEEFFRRGEGYGYDNFTTLDTFKTEINNEDIFLKTDLGKGVILYLPIIGSPMDSVVNARVAIVLALHGGIAVIHYNHKKSNNEQDIDAQIAEIDRVKRYQSGFIEKPITVSPEMNIAQVLALAEGYLEQGMSITNFPVTENGKSNGKLLGLLRRQDYFRGSRVESKVSERMLPLRELKVATEPVNLEQAVDIIWNQRLNALPIVNNSGNLVYLVTRSDIEKRERYPLATLDRIID